MQGNKKLPADQVDTLAQSITNSYTPQIQPLCALHPIKCYLGTAPALGKISHLLGPQFATSWLTLQIDFYSQTLKTADQFTETDTQNLAMVILANYPWLNLAEIMLFFSRLAAGHYGQVAYGTLKAENITAKIPQFIKQRSAELERHERQLSQQRRQREYTRRQKYAVTYQHYQKIKAQAIQHFNGDENKALQYLQSIAPPEET